MDSDICEKFKKNDNNPIEAMLPAQNILYYIEPGYLYVCNQYINDNPKKYL